MLHEIFRASNLFWYAMYYDELFDNDAYQISYVKNADRLYFNCAHAIKASSVGLIRDVEAYFGERHVPPAFYVDGESSLDLEQALVARGYVEVGAEQENWYIFDCSQGGAVGFEKKIDFFKRQNFALECIIFSPSTDSFLLKQFLALDGEVNGISVEQLEKLKQNLMVPKIHGIQFMCLLVHEQHRPASIGLIGLCGDMAFLAEGATHTDFRRRGIYTWLNQIAVVFAVRNGVKKIIVNCDVEAYSNNTFRRLGFKSLDQRRFFIKREEKLS